MGGRTIGLALTLGALCVALAIALPYVHDPGAVIWLVSLAIVGSTLSFVVFANQGRGWTP